MQLRRQKPLGYEKKRESLLLPSIECYDSNPISIATGPLPFTAVSSFSAPLFVLLSLSKLPTIYTSAYIDPWIRTVTFPLLLTLPCRHSIRKYDCLE